MGHLAKSSRKSAGSKLIATKAGKNTVHKLRVLSKSDVEEQRCSAYSYLAL